MLFDFFRRNKSEYVSVKSYEREVEKIDKEIADINKTIKFYEAKRRILEEWRKVVKVGIKKENESEVCKNCCFFKSGFCLKYEGSVNKEATCADFMWDIG